MTLSKLKENGGGQSEVGYSLVILSILFLVLGLTLLAIFEHDLKYKNK